MRRTDQLASLGLNAIIFNLGIIAINSAVRELVVSNYIDKRVFVVTGSKLVLVALSSWEVTSALVRNYLEGPSHLRELNTLRTCKTGKKKHFVGAD